MLRQLFDLMFTAGITRHESHLSCIQEAVAAGLAYRFPVDFTGDYRTLVPWDRLGQVADGVDAPRVFNRVVGSTGKISAQIGPVPACVENLVTTTVVSRFSADLRSLDGVVGVANPTPARSLNGKSAGHESDREVSLSELSDLLKIGGLDLHARRFRGVTPVLPNPVGGFVYYSWDGRVFAHGVRHGEHLLRAKRLARETESKVVVTAPLTIRTVDRNALAQLSDRWKILMVERVIFERLLAPVILKDDIACYTASIPLATDPQKAIAVFFPRQDALALRFGRALNGAGCLDIVSLLLGTNEPRSRSVSDIDGNSVPGSTQPPVAIPGDIHSEQRLCVDSLTGPNSEPQSLLTPSGTSLDQRTATVVSLASEIESRGAAALLSAKPVKRATGRVKSVVQ
jgi:hypothetical protein